MLFKKSSLFAGHSGSVYTLAKLDDVHFVSGSGDKIVAKWNFDFPDKGEMIANVTSVVYSLLFIPEKNTMLVGTASGGIHVVDLNDRAEKHLLQYHKQGIFDLKISKAKNLLVVASGEGVITFCRLHDYSIIKQVQLCNSKLRSIDFSIDENFIAIGCGDGSIAIFDSEKLEKTNQFQAHKNDWSVNAVCFHSSGNVLLSASRDAMLNVYDAKNNFTLLESIAAHNYSIYDIQVSPDLKYFATASRDKSVKIWNADDLSFVQKLDKEKTSGHVNSVNKLLWMNEKRLLSCSDDRSIIEWILL